MNKAFLKILMIGLLAVGLFSCEDYFGEKTDLDFIDVPDYDATRQVAYVPILPVLDGFSRPTDVMVGFDELIYVVDNGSQEVIAMDEAGRVVGRKFIPGAISLAQDRKFDLLVIGTHDTALVEGSDTNIRSFSAIYRINQFGGGGYNLSHSRVVNKIVHPYYYKSNANGSDEVEVVRFNKLAIIGSNSDPVLNNQFYATRQGAKTSGTLGPDDAVVYFDNQDQFISTLNVVTSSGVFNNYFEDPSGITTNAQPPQLTSGGGRNFIYTSLDPTNTLQVQVIEYTETDFSSSYSPSLLATGDTSRASGFVNSPNKFDLPNDVTIAGDASQYIFITDAGTDSLYQFTRSGFEGVLPPAATGITKFQKTSFGGTGSGVRQFKNPMGVAYFNEIVYVADAGNGRILRFKLTTDFQ